MTRGLLASLNILDFSTLLPGPYASLLLADLGANVVRVEAPDRPDLARLTPPFDGDTSAWHAVLNRNKRSLALNLKAPGAADMVKRLVQRYDIVLEQFRPGVMDRLGVGYAALREANPRLIYVALTGYGQTGPYRDRAGHDINYLALAGVSSHLGRREGGPVPLGVQVADVGAGSLLAVMGLLSAEIHRRVTGEGQFVDVSMFDGAVAWNTLALAHYFASGQNPAPEEQWLNGGSFYDYYETADGRYLAVGSLEPKFWTGFCRAIGRSDLINPGFSLAPANQRYVKAEIQAAIRAKTWAEWSAIFAAEDVCVEPVLTVAEMLEHPQTQARGLVAAVPRGDGTTRQQAAAPVKFSAESAVYRHIGKKLGADSVAVLAEIGFSADEIAAFVAQGTVAVSE